MVGRFSCMQFAIHLLIKTDKCSAVAEMALRLATIDHHHHTTTVLRPLFHDCPGKPVQENFWTLWCKGRLTEADTQTIRLGSTPSGLTSAHLHQSPPIRGAGVGLATIDTGRKMGVCPFGGNGAGPSVVWAEA